MTKRAQHTELAGKKWRVELTYLAHKNFLAILTREL